MYTSCLCVCDCQFTYIQGLLADEQVADAPVLVLGNKIDSEGAVSEEQLRLTLKLHGQTTGKVREPQTFPMHTENYALAVIRCVSNVFLLTALRVILDSARLKLLSFAFLFHFRGACKESTCSVDRSKSSCAPFSRDRAMEKVSVVYALCVPWAN